MRRCNLDEVVGHFISKRLSQRGWKTISRRFRDRVILLVQGTNPGVTVLTGN
jgi:hypothetical protein